MSASLDMCTLLPMIREGGYYGLEVGAVNGRPRYEISVEVLYDNTRFIRMRYNYDDGGWDSHSLIVEPIDTVKIAWSVLDKWNKFVHERLTEQAERLSSQAGGGI